MFGVVQEVADKEPNRWLAMINQLIISDGCSGSFKVQ
jgi:hypothetical protein